MLELNKIYCGDCLELMKEIDDKSIDCVVTSPPYNKTGLRGKRDNSKGNGRWSGADISYGSFLDDMDEQEYQLWQINILNELHRIIKDNGSIFYNHKIRRNNNKASHPFEWISKSNCSFYQQIIWDRSSSCDGNIGYFTPTTELIFWLIKDKPTVNKLNNRFSSEVWKINPDSNNSHPAPFPLELVSNCILNTTKEGDIVFDPFMGSGTTAKSAKINKRNFIGLELNPEYCKIAEDRLRQNVLF